MSKSHSFPKQGKGKIQANGGNVSGIKNANYPGGPATKD